MEFDFIYDFVKDLYSSDKGRPSIDPVVFVKMVFIQYVFGIRSMGQTIKEIETNVAYRWFLGFGFEDKIPHFSTFGKNYARRFRESDVFEQIFYRILRNALDQPKRVGKKFNASDACFRCHELSQLALEEHPSSSATN